MFCKEDISRIIAATKLEKALMFAVKNNDNIDSDRVINAITIPEVCRASSQKFRTDIINAAEIVSGLTTEDDTPNEGSKVLELIIYLTGMNGRALVLPTDDIELLVENIILVKERLKTLIIETLTEKTVLRIGVNQTMFMDAIKKVNSSIDSSSIIMSSGVVNAINKISALLLVLSDSVLSVNSYVGGDNALLEMVSTQANRPSIQMYRNSKLKDVYDTILCSLDILKKDNSTGQRDMSSVLNGDVKDMIDYDSYILSDENMEKFFTAFQASLDVLESLKLEGLQTICEDPDVSNKDMVISIKLKIDLLISLIQGTGRVLEDFICIAADIDTDSEL